MRTGGPVTLTRGQFGKTTAGQKPGAKYEGYLAYINRRRAAKLAQPAAPADPFAPTSDTDIDSIVNRFTGMYGKPKSDADIQSSAQGLLDPIVAAITANITGQAKTATGAIGANSEALAKAMAGQDYGAPYAGAKQEQAAADAALQQGLAGGGASLAGDLKSRLAMIDDPTVAAAGDQVAAQGVAAGNTELAHGTSALSSLIAAAAANKAYGAKLPNIARLTGLQDIAGAERDATKQIGDQTSQVEQQLPNVVQGFRSERDNLVGNKASIAAQIYGLLTGQNITKQTAKAGLENTDFDNRLSYASTFGTDPQTGQPVKGYHVDSGGNVVKDVAPKPVKPLSTTDKARIAKAVQDFRYGVQPKQQFNAKTQSWMDVPGTGTPNMSYEEAYQGAIALGATPEYARTLVNGLYKPGEYGRPLSAGQKKTNAAVKAGVGVPKTAAPFAGLNG